MSFRNAGCVLVLIKDEPTKHRGNSHPDQLFGWAKHLVTLQLFWFVYSFCFPSLETSESCAPVRVKRLRWKAVCIQQANTNLHPGSGLKRPNPGFERFVPHGVANSQQLALLLTVHGQNQTNSERRPRWCEGQFLAWCTMAKPAFASVPNERQALWCTFSILKLRICA